MHSRPTGSPLPPPPFSVLAPADVLIAVVAYSKLGPAFDTSLPITSVLPPGALKRLINAVRWQSWCCCRCCCAAAASGLGSLSAAERSLQQAAAGPQPGFRCCLAPLSHLPGSHLPGAPNPRLQALLVRCLVACEWLPGGAAACQALLLPTTVKTCCCMGAAVASAPHAPHAGPPVRRPQMC